MRIVRTLIVFSLLALRVRSRWKSRSIAFSHRIDPQRDKIPRSSLASLVLIIIANARKQRIESIFFEATANQNSATSGFFSVYLYSSHKSGKFSTLWTSTESWRLLNIIMRHRLNDIQCGVRFPTFISDRAAPSALRAQPDEVKPLSCTLQSGRFHLTLRLVILLDLESFCDTYTLYRL